MSERGAAPNDEVRDGVPTNPARTTTPGRPAVHPETELEIDFAAEASFPASDPPSWNAMRPGGPKRAAPRDAAP